MEVEFQIRGLNDDDSFRERLITGLQDLNGRMPIAHANVVLEQQCESRLRYQAVVVLRVTGPDIRAAARDHTWEGVWRKVISRLWHEVEERLEATRTR